MQLRNLRALRGPNRWTRATALELDVELGVATPGASDSERIVRARLEACLPTAFQEGDPARETPAHWVGRTVLALQNLAGSRVVLQQTAPTSEPGVYKVVVEYREE